MIKFAVNDRVGEVVGKPIRYGDEPCYGCITDILSDGRVIVKWDYKWKNVKAVPMNPQNLVSEAELSKKYSELEQEFNKISLIVKKKLESAGQIILDAEKLAREAGLYLQDMHSAIAPLESAMGQAGWQTSSWNC